MTKTKLIFIGLALALVGFLSAGSAAADGHEPTVTVDPSYVEEAGEHTITVTGTGWSASPVAVLPCNYDDDGNVIENTCNQGNMQVVSALDADGGFTVEITVDVPEEGIHIGAGSFDRSETAATTGRGGAGSIQVGMMEEMPATGVNTSLLVIIGAGIALAGVMVFGLSRRLRTL